MSDLRDELAQTHRRMVEMVAEVRQTSIDWRHRVHAQMELFEQESSGEVSDQDDSLVPAGAPVQYAAVRNRVSRGELDWFDVLSGRADDPEARAVHMWADARLETIRKAWRLLEGGSSLDEAVAGAGGEEGMRGERR